MIEGGRLPCRSIVAGTAGLRESTRDVVRVRSVLEILEVAGNARRAGQVVVVPDMAIGALPWRDCVSASQNKIYHRVIERCG